MALSGNIDKQFNNGRTYRIAWSGVQDVAKNQTTITCNHYLINGRGYSIYIGNRNNTCTVDGVAVDFTSPWVSSEGSTTDFLGTTTHVVTHASDGTKTVTISSIFRIQAELAGTYWASVTASATVTLDTIPRASTASLVSPVYFGSTNTIKINRASTAFTHTITYSFGSATGTIATKTSATEVTWVPSKDLAYQIPNSLSGLCTLTCQTYNGNTLIGTTTFTATLYCLFEMKPTAGSLVATRVNGEVPSSWPIYVQGKSKCKLTVTGAQGSYGSTIVSYSITGGGLVGTSSTMTTGLLNNEGYITFTARVTDSRGVTSDEVSVQIYVTPYSPPFFTGFTANRCTSLGLHDVNGTYLYGCAYFNYAGRPYNSVTTAIYYRRAGQTAWTNANYAFETGKGFVCGDGKLSGEYTYEIKFELTDAFNTVSVFLSLSTSDVVLDLKYGGSGISFGKVAEFDQTFEVSDKWDVRVYGMLLDAYIRSIVSSGGGGGIAYATCSTTYATAAKVASSSDDFTLQTGAMVAVKFTYYNTATSPTLNVNSTGAKNIVSYSSSSIATYSWRSGQTLLFVYDGTRYVALGTTTASTTYYGVTMLNNTVTSTSTTLAATAYAVKQAYDRSSWPSITLTTPLAVAYGGTGANNAATARTNLGITATSLYNGTLTTGSTTFALGYKVFVIIGQPTTASARAACVVPASMITTAAVNFQFADESNYYSFDLSYSGTTVTLKYHSRSSNGQILRVFGIN